MTEVDGISDNAVRDKLKEGYEALDAGEIATALVCAGVSYTVARRVRERQAAANSPYQQSFTLKAIVERAGRVSHSPMDASRDVKDIVEANNQGFARLGEIVDLMSLGLDPLDYAAMIEYGPIIHEILGGPPVAHWGKQPTTDKKVAKRCLDFAHSAARAFGI